MKTAISLDQELFEKLESAAGELGTTRSGLIARALEDFLARRENQRLLEQLNVAYGTEPVTEPGDAVVREGMRHRQRHIVEEEW